MFVRQYSLSKLQIEISRSLTKDYSYLMLDWFRQVHVQKAARVLIKGGVIAYPTEAVWGLGADPFNAAAVYKLLSLKKRRVDKGLIIVAAHIEQLAPYLLTLSTQQQQQLRASWPGPTTWLIPHNGLFPYWIHGEYSSVAVRVSDHPVVQGLCLAFGGPIVSTSANLQGKTAARFSWQVHHYFKQHIDCYAPGRVGGRKKPSEIRDLLSGQVVRQS